MISTKNIPVVRREFLLPFIIVTSLFALWGIANDLTNPMVMAFKKVMPELTNIEASMVQFAFYFGYFLMALPAALFIRKFSYKAGIIVGLALYALGTFLFYPAAMYQEFVFFLLSLWILTCGLAFLETTANPLILSLGDPETATRRLNLAQSFNPLGSLTGMMIAQFFIISHLRSYDYSVEAYRELTPNEAIQIRENDLDVISMPYIFLGVVVVCILVIVLLIKIPNPTYTHEMVLSKSFKKLKGNITYLHGVIAQVFYVGAQIMCWTYIFQYVDYLNQTHGLQLTATYYNVFAMVLFLTGRWLGTYLMKKIKPAKLLMVFGLLASLCCLGTILLPNILGLYALVAVSAFMSIMFPTIYGIALKDMGEESKIGSAGLVMAIVGGAILPVVQGAILDWGGNGLADLTLVGFIPEVKFSFVLPLISLAIVTHFGYKQAKH